MASRRDAGRLAEHCKRLSKEYVPEIVCLMMCLMLAALLRARGNDHVQASDAEAWAQITAQWPLLLTADTLLSLQAMLRLLVLLSTVLRAGSGDSPAPLSDEASALWLGANTA